MRDYLLFNDSLATAISLYFPFPPFIILDCSGSCSCLKDGIRKVRRKQECILKYMKKVLRENYLRGIESHTHTHSYLYKLTYICTQRQIDG